MQGGVLLLQNLYTNAIRLQLLLHVQNHVSCTLKLWNEQHVSTCNTTTVLKKEVFGKYITGYMINSLFFKVIHRAKEKVGSGYTRGVSLTKFYVNRFRYCKSVDYL